MKNKIVFLFALCAFVSNTSAQTTYDVYTYKEPVGFTKEETDGKIKFENINQTTGVYCIISLWKSQPLPTGITNAFEYDWNDIIKTNYQIEAPKAKAEKANNTWTYFSGKNSFNFNNQPCFVSLYNFSKNNISASIILLTNNETDNKKIVNDFLQSLKLKTITTTATNNNSTKPTNPTTTNNDEPELWFTYKLSGTKYMTMEPNFYLVYKNGDYKDEAPWQGLLSFNATQNKQEFPLGWGKFVMNNNGNGTFTINNYTEKVVKLSADKMDRPEASWDYMKCKSVNNLKLQASYSHQEGWSTNATFNNKTCKDLLTLNKDGSFVDNGFFLGSCEYASTSPKDAPGSGTYSIQNFTIQLKYTDGRITERLLCGLGTANPFIENGSIFIGHQMVYNK